MKTPINTVMKSGDFVIFYLKYLTKWNKSASLLSVIKEMSLKSKESYENRTNHPKWDKELLKEITNIAIFEHTDTQDMTSDKVLSMEEVLSELTRKNRDKKLNKLLK